MSERKTAIIIGGGPAGLTAAYELLRHTNIVPVVLERSPLLGGISRTELFEGNRIDIGGHRFFSKSDIVMKFWLDILPLEKGQEGAFTMHYQGQQTEMARLGTGPDPDTEDEVMLVRSRKSRIYWNRRLLEYPLRMSWDTIQKVGLARMAVAGTSYALARVRPIREEKTLEDFLINRFGRQLYTMFFESYTEKVWGVPCREISAEWGAQRIKGLSIWKAIQHALKPKPRKDVSQKNVETSLIERFLYPKHGPGQMWTTVGKRIRSLGGQVRLGTEVVELHSEGKRLTGVKVRRLDTGEDEFLAADYVISSMAIRDLFRALPEGSVPRDVSETADGLVYRDFFTIGLLADGLKLRDPDGGMVRDNWIYIQDPDVLMGRLQIFNNWSPYMVADPSLVWVGLEYFCFDTDEIWSRSDADLIELGKRELDELGIVDAARVRKGTVIRVKKTYPAYFGTYDRFHVIREHLDGYENLYCVGRNGQHRYNNQDHSMLTAMKAVDHIRTGLGHKAEVWDVNVEKEYHEERASS